MCGTCGSHHGPVLVNGVVLDTHDHPGHGRSDQHGHRHLPMQERDATRARARPHAHPSSEPNVLRIEQDLLSKNNVYAADNRAAFQAAGALALNIISSPGAGKTTLLVATIEALRGRRPVVVIEGDQQTSLDAARIRATGATAIQINTGQACHLDAHMVGHAAETLSLEPGSVLFIENVGNLVCPAAFDLGEAQKVTILSTTEGDDKPLKYPDAFTAASLMIVSKIDLLPHVDFSVDRCIENARSINPAIEILQLSSRTGEGTQGWLNWIDRAAELVARKAAEHAHA